MIGINKRIEYKTNLILDLLRVLNFKKTIKNEIIRTSYEIIDAPDESITIAG
jgi:hypothetical protein